MRTIDWSVLVMIGLTMGGCSTAHHGRADGGMCTPLYEPCEGDNDCCDGYCPRDTYGPIVCTPRGPSGVFCTSNNECESRDCVSNICGGAEPPPPPPPAECLEEHAICISNPFDSEPDETRPCCEGLTCAAAVSYGPSSGYCERLRSDGESCDHDGHSPCASGFCSDGICRSGTCVGDDQVCGWHAGCCTGYCNVGEGYGSSLCRPKESAGGYCHDDLWCRSGRCLAFRCAGT